MSVRESLRAQGITEFLPVAQFETRWSDRLVTTTRPIFTGYVFARFDAASSAPARRAVLETHGVCGILSADGQPSAIPDAEIASLRIACEAPAKKTLRPYVPGEMIRVRSGPFAGIEGVIVRVKDGASLAIPITILGRAVNVEIDLRDLDAPKPAAKPKGTL